ncbi:MAG: aspartate kinase [Oscillospiraceae bacterium]|nr:aspartate kinase [Oscillospiraceae bacterium]
MLIVQKFGGSSVADAARISRVAAIIGEAYRAGNQVVVVLSAQGDTTDDLIAKAREINPKPDKREMDMLLSVGEQISVSLMAMELQKHRIPAVSLCGWQIGLTTTGSHTAGRIETIDTGRILRELESEKVVLIAGFQGIDHAGDITTLGRGGSDTTAVAVAAVLHADRCQIFTDVEGVFTADPRKVPGARLLKSITYDEMLELASSGSQVLHNRSVELAKQYGVVLEVLSSFLQRPGTKVQEATRDVERMIISGVAKDDHIARVTVGRVPDRPGAALKLFQVLSDNSVNVDNICQSASGSGRSDIGFTVAEDDADTARTLLQKARPEVGYEALSVTRDVSKVSIVGAGLLASPGMAVRMFEALTEENINISMISSSEIKLSVVIPKSDADRAVAAIHGKFFGTGERLTLPGTRIRKGERENAGL